MSRSFKKHVHVDDAGCKKLPKRWAARAVRHAKHVPDGGQYKKFFNSYNIDDFGWRMEKPIKGAKPKYLFDPTYEEKLKEYRKAKRK